MKTDIAMPLSQVPSVVSLGLDSLCMFLHATLMSININMNPKSNNGVKKIILDSFGINIYPLIRNKILMFKIVVDAHSWIISCPEQLGATSAKS